MKTKLVKLHLAKEPFKFSSGHFTIFSESKRERLHGHNFTVAVSIICSFTENEMAFDYALAKKTIQSLCDELDERVLLPANSKFLEIEEEDLSVRARFGEDAFLFPRGDVILMPLENITVEGLADWFCERLARNWENEPEYKISHVSVRISSGPGQTAEVEREIGSTA